MTPWLQWMVGLGLGVTIAALAWRVGALKRSGAFAAALLGGLLFGLGGLRWAVLLLLFFVTSSGLSTLSGRRKAALAEKFAKGSRRDWAQVAANGGLGVLLALIDAVWPGQGWVWVAYAGCLAAVNADTWATELGVLSKTAPRLVTTWRPVERGASGGVSLAGTLASLGGALVIGMAAGWLQLQPAGWVTCGAAALGGVAGSLFDSWLGATQQAIYSCPTCQKETEQHPVHRCGNPTTLLRGWRWLNNDLVNVACALVGAGVAVGVWALVR